MIKAGVKIGDGAVIGMGSIVTHDVGAYEIWVGNPARLIRKRFDEETINELMKTKWWEWEDQSIEKYAEDFTSPESFVKNLEEISK